MKIVRAEVIYDVSTMSDSFAERLRQGMVEICERILADRDTLPVTYRVVIEEKEDE